MEYKFKGYNRSIQKDVYGDLLQYNGRYYIVPEKETYTDDFNFLTDCFLVAKDSVKIRSNKKDINERWLYEGDVVEVIHDMDSFRKSVFYTIQFGKYEQDGSNGEYSSTECYGFYLKYEYHILNDWVKYDEDLSDYEPRDYEKTISLYDSFIKSIEYAGLDF